jgi:FixJ family two-component response regulator
MIVERSASIWIVDDDEDVRLALKNFLRSAGCDVRTFDGADGVLSALKVGAPGCVITDLHMPGMDGLALQEEFNALGRSFPVIVMTAFPGTDAKKRSMMLGASAFLSKPIDPEELLRMVRMKLGAFDG